MTSLIAPFLALLYTVNLARFVLSQNEQICLPVPPNALETLQGRKGDPGPPGQCQCDLSEVVAMRETFIRVLPSLRDEFCLAGVKSGKVRDDEMDASSKWAQAEGAHAGRLDGGARWAPHPSKQQPGEWLQVDLRTPTRVTGVVTQGRGVIQGERGWRVTSFKISFGDSINQLQVIQDVDGNDMIFQGNSDGISRVENIFPNPIRARYFRLTVVTFNHGINLRLDYLTC
ncbi:unnamed protein product [Clavelina lepadiformis]|uniref:F5/8 type C domain-containing protein n=1 Tax=Clavelina lepadiformis TaxID=159417 RepID=A0ABP0EUR7_CLALP